MAEKNNLGFSFGQASQISFSEPMRPSHLPPPFAGAAAMTTPLESPLLAFTSRYTYTTPLVSPAVARFSLLNQLVAPRRPPPFNAIPATTHFTFVPTPSARPSSSSLYASQPTAHSVDSNLDWIINPSLQQLSSASTLGTTFFATSSRRYPLQAMEKCLPQAYQQFSPCSNPFGPWKINHGSSSSEADEFAKPKKEAPLRGRLYACGECHMGFPTAQAYGGHMSSHSKARKAQLAVGEAFVPLKKVKPTRIHTPLSNIIPEHGEDLGLTTVSGNLNFLSGAVDSVENDDYFADVHVEDETNTVADEDELSGPGEEAKEENLVVDDAEKKNNPLESLQDT